MRITYESPCGGDSISKSSPAVVIIFCRTGYYIKQVVLVYLRSYKCLTMDVDKSNLSILESMGFLNEEANYNALKLSNNNLESAIEILSNPNITDNG